MRRVLLLDRFLAAKPRAADPSPPHLWSPGPMTSRCRSTRSAHTSATRPLAGPPTGADSPGSNLRPEECSAARPGLCVTSNSASGCEDDCWLDLSFQFLRLLFIVNRR